MTVAAIAKWAGIGLIGHLLEALHSSWTSWERARIEYVTTAASGDVVSRRRIWVDGQRTRIEEEGWPQLSRLAIRDGDRWWTYSPEAGALVGEDTLSRHASFGRPPIELLRPASLMGALRFESIVEGERLGRRVLRARGLLAVDPRWAPAGILLHALGYPAHEYLFDIDAERGVLLASEAHAEREVSQRITAVEVAFDESFAADLFVFDPPAGEEIRAWESAFSRWRDVSLSSAVAEAPFGVFALETLSPGWTARAQWSPGQERPPAPAWVSISYTSPDGSESATISQTADPGVLLDAELGGGPPWSKFGDGGLRGVVRERTDTFEQSQLSAVRDGTRIDMHSSTLGADELVALARGLVPASEEQARL